MHMRGLAAALVAAVFVSALAPASAEEPKPSAAEIEALLDATDEIAAKVAEIRGLKVKKKIARGALSREEITRRLLEKIDEEYKPEEIEDEARAWKRLGLLPANADYKALVIDVLTEQVAGFYDPDAKELYIADWMEADGQRMVMAHEIDHALQDQHFDLDKFVVPSKDNGDLQLARQALVEGDGMALMIEFVLAEQGVKMDPWADDSIVKMMGAQVASTAATDKLGQAPLFLREQLLFPYAAGVVFVAATRKTQAWSAIDAMYRKPPLSTEQILHPEKYAAGEKPIAVKSAALPSAKKWKKVFENTLGELMWDVLLRQHGVDARRAKTAAEGWGGDRLLVLEAPGGEVVAMTMSAWDAEMDAIEAFDAAKEAAATLAGAAAAFETADDYAAFKDAAGTVTFVERKGSVVVWTVGAPADAAPKLRKEMWQKWKGK